MRPHVPTCAYMVPHVPAEPEFIFAEPATSEMRFMARQMATVNRELAQHNRKVMRTVGRWLDLYEWIKFLESEDLMATDPLRIQQQAFHAALRIVHGLGCLLLMKLQNDDAEQLKSLGCPYPDLVACVEELASLERMLTGDMTPGMVAEMNEKLFNSAQPRG